MHPETFHIPLRGALLFDGVLRRPNFPFSANAVRPIQSKERNIRGLEGQSVCAWALNRYRFILETASMWLTDEQARAAAAMLVAQTIKAV